MEEELTLPPSYYHHAFARVPDDGLWRLCVMSLLRVPKNVMTFDPYPRHAGWLGKSNPPG